MKIIILSVTASLLALGLGMAPFAAVQAAPDAPLIEAPGDQPILLHRMVITATPLAG